MRKSLAAAVVILLVASAVPTANGSHRMQYATTDGDGQELDLATGDTGTLDSLHELTLTEAITVRLCSFDADPSWTHSATWTTASLTASTNDTSCDASWSLAAGTHPIQIAWTFTDPGPGAHTLESLVRFLPDATEGASGHPGESEAITFQILRPDADGDGVEDSIDACPGHDDAVDPDGDDLPNGCDGDDDNDGVLDEDDDYPTNPNRASGIDADNDGIDDEFDADRDGDGISNEADACPDVHDDQVDSDGDGAGNACDSDDDDDGVPDAEDQFPTNSNRASGNDLDSDGIDDEFDGDDDGDGAPDGSDVCPRIADGDQTDSDGDGAGDACDSDDDNDGVPDHDDAFPLDATRSETGDDGDGVIQSEDNCPSIPNNDQADQDLDGRGDACDPDRDGDGIDNTADSFPDNRNRASGNDRDGDGIDDEFDDDDDNDGHNDSVDNCPTLASNNLADSDGDGLGDVCDGDDDNDGVNDDSDKFPTNANRASGQDLDLDGIDDEFDADDDQDGINDDADNCPRVNNPSQANTDGDAQGNACDNDDDNDGTLDRDDAFPLDANRHTRPPASPPASSQPVPTNVVNALAADTGIALATDETIAFTDQDGDGKIDGVAASKGSVGLEHTAPNASLLMVRQGGVFAVIEPSSGAVHPVQVLSGNVSAIDRVVDAADGEESSSVTVTVPEKTGWIRVSIADPFPEEPVSSLVRSDGLVIPVDQVWRSDGELHFMDDPETGYTLGFGGIVSNEGPVAESPTGAKAADSQDTTPPVPFWVWPLLALVLLVAFVGWRRIPRA